MNKQEKDNSENRLRALSLAKEIRADLKKGNRLVILETSLLAVSGGLAAYGTSVNISMIVLCAMITAVLTLVVLREYLNNLKIDVCLKATILDAINEDLKKEGKKAVENPLS